MLFSEFHTIKLLWTLLLLIKILFCIIFQYYSFFDNREMCLSVLQQAKKFRCLEWLDKPDKNMKPWVLIWWSLVNYFRFNLLSILKAYFSQLVIYSLVLQERICFCFTSWYAFLRISLNQVFIVSIFSLVTLVS
jgi:hypothetical protein